MRKATGVAGAIVAGAILTSAALAAAISPYQSSSVSPTQGTQINRSNKGDSQPVVASNQAPKRIVTVEVIGVEDAAIVYRDRDGRVLFKTDPLSNTTVVTKGVVLPEVTVREIAGAEVKRLPAETVRPTLSPTSPGDGCESSVTAHTAPAELARVPSRCITQLPGKNNVVAQN